MDTQKTTNGRHHRPVCLSVSVFIWVPLTFFSQFDYLTLRQDLGSSSQHSFEWFEISIHVRKFEYVCVFWLVKIILWYNFEWCVFVVNNFVRVPPNHFWLLFYLFIFFLHFVPFLILFLYIQYNILCVFILFVQFFFLFNSILGYWPTAKTKTIRRKTVKAQKEKKQHKNQKYSYSYWIIPYILENLKGR